ncbi:MAG: beta-propeller domain-containing protein [Candidatus Aenigmatarchaeota archaeon]
MKKLILLGIIAVVAFAGIYYFFPQAFQQTADNQPKQFSSAAEMNAFINASSGMGFSGGVMTGAASEMSTQKSVSDISQQSSSESGAPSSGSVDYSRTNIQVAGVDEADIVKTDGKYIYAVSGSNVLILDAYPAENASIISQIETNGTVGEIYINGNRLVVFGQENYQYSILATKTATGVSDMSGAISEKMTASESVMRPYYYSPRTFISVYDVSDKANPSLARNISVDGIYYESRMIGDYVYVIANQPVYNYGGGSVPLPVLYSNSVARETPASDIYYFGMPDSSFIFTNIVSLNTQTAAEPLSKTFLMGYSQSIYVSQDNIYLTYQKRVGELKIYDRMVDEIILPLVPSDVRGKINEVRNSNASSYDKMQQIGKLFEDYLGTLNPEQAAAVMKTGEEKMARMQADIAKEMEKTVIHKISIDGGNIEYKANGEVPGQPLNQFSMDEYGGYFRIATTTSGNGGFFGGGFATGTVMSQTAVASSATGKMSSSATSEASGESISQGELVQSVPENRGIDLNDSRKSEAATLSAEEQAAKAIPEQITPMQTVALAANPNGPLNHLYVLDGDLKIVGKVEDLAAGERIYSARFLGDKAYMVTFRQIDPLFVIDLSSPQNPQVLGYLKIPGVSDYLHPYDETHIIGVGRDASDEGRIKGLKLALFDVSDFANPKEVSKYVIGDRGTDSEALYDHKAFLFDKEKNLLAIPVSEYTYAEQNMTELKEEKWTPPKYWQGAYVFNLDLANGFVLKGKITHQNSTKNSTYYYDWNSQIRRSLFIDNTLYTISNTMVKMNSLVDLAEINKVALPAQAQRYYGGIGMME